jgi:hypothetical protein
MEIRGKWKNTKSKNIRTGTQSENKLYENISVMRMNAMKFYLISLIKDNSLNILFIS